MYYIAYFHQGIPGGSSSPERFESLDAAKREFEKFPDAVFASPEMCSATVYSFDDDDSEAWVQAQEFADVGCPFDYPNYLMSFGPRGGLRVEST